MLALVSQEELNDVLASFLDASNNFYFIYDEEVRCVFINNAFLKKKPGLRSLKDVSNEEILGESFFIVELSVKEILKNKKALRLEQGLKLFDKEELYVVDYKLLGKNGNLVLIEVYENHGGKGFLSLAERYGMQEKAILASGCSLVKWNLVTGEYLIDDEFFKKYSLDFGEKNNTFLSFQNAIHAEDKFLVMKKIQQVLKSEVSFYDIQYRLKSTLGSWIWFQERCEVVAWTNKGDPLLILGLRQDISLQKREWEANFIQKKIEEQIFQQIPGEIFLINYEGEIIDFNKKTLDKLGYSEKELKLQKFDDICPQFNIEDIKKHFWGESGSNYVFEGIHIKSDGDVYSAEIRVSRCNVQKQEYIIIHSNDITDKKYVEIELQEMKQRFEDVVDAMRGFVWELDMKGRFSYISEQVKEVIGFSGKELVGKLVFDLIDKAQVDNIFNKFNKVFEKEKPFNNVEIKFRNKLGGSIWLSISGKPIMNQKGVYIGVRGSAFDINTSLNQKIALQNSEKRYELVINAISAGIWDWDIKTGEILWTGTLFKMLGLSMENPVVSYDEFLSYLHPKDKDFVINSVGAHLKENKDYEIEFRMRKVTGDYIWVSEKGKALRDEEGVAYRMVGSVIDITEQKKAREEFLEASARLEAVLHSASVFSVIATDNTGVITLFNRGAEALLGYTANEIIGKKTPTLFHVESELNSHAGFLKRELGLNVSGFDVLVAVTLTEGYEEAEWNYKCREGKLIPVNLTVSSIRKSNGQSIGYLFLAQDITNKKESERELKRLSLVASKTSTGVCITDENGYVEWVNSAYTGMTGYILSEIYNKTPHSFLLGGETDPNTVKYISDCIRERKAYSAEILYYHKSKTPYWARIEANPIFDENGKLTQFVSIENDISEKKKAETEILSAKMALESINDQLGDALARANQMAVEAELASQAKSTFLATMSHEIRTPMNAVIGYADLVLDSSLSHEQRDYIQAIRNGGDTLLTLINDILDYSKIESGKMTLEYLPFNLRNCIEDSLDLVSAKALKKGVNIYYEIEKDTPIQLVSDVTRVKQILVNLLSNGVKFTEKGEVSIRVSAKKREGDAYEYHFSVRDSGIGLSEEGIKRLFKSFSQATESTSRKYGGTGLGLAISKKLTEMMGGDIWVESKEGVGSDFQFTIVANIESSCSSKGEEFLYQSRKEFLNKRILVVANFQSNQDILKSFLSKWGFSVEVVDSITGIESIFKEGREVQACIVCMCLENLNLDDYVRVIREYFVDLPIIAALCFHFIGNSDVLSGKIGIPIKPIQLYDAVIKLFEVVTGNNQQKVNQQSAFDKTLGERCPLSILMAEDNKVNQVLAVKMLEKMGYKCDIAEDGLQVLEAAEKKYYDIIFMDLQMPNLDGFDAAKRLKVAKTKNSNMYVVALTASAMEEDRKRSAEVGMQDYITKPLRIRDLQEIFERAYEYKISKD